MHQEIALKLRDAGSVAHVATFGRALDNALVFRRQTSDGPLKISDGGQVFVET